MATPVSPEDWEVSDFELASSTSGTSVTLSSTSLVSVESRCTDEEEEEEGMLKWGYLSERMTMESEFQVWEATRGWHQAFLEVSDRCYDYTSQVGRSLENRSRNRYANVSPYDHSRMQGEDEQNNYINASFVMVEEAQRKYILTRGPLPNKCSHFWLMVWQQNSRAVIMLNHLVENNNTKCSQYWPLCQGQTLLFKEMGISVCMLKEEVRISFTVHFLRLKSTMMREVRSVFHFHYTGRADFGVPKALASFLSFLFMVRESGCLNDEQGPAVIHCSAGIGRSGIFALVNTCLVLMEKREDPFCLNIRQVLVNLRKYRMGLIQTPKQLRFFYMAVIKGVKFLMADENFKKKWKALSNVRPGPSYDESLSQTHTEFEDTVERDAGFSDLATRTPNSGGREQ
ncbi:tyrosine-protein phosphatase non-receptor type 2-like [Dromiciops gliroides]|uniref:tyrosine-protein phosphatase non-receptor type 2-like n=1 Tax=Dromiciops gliroides TaxID=33562 RepID=UPI001CC78197|nr:tyrosine-protein phosphatase non-receptor type 2-like [Dromiciops gliroides]